MKIITINIGSRSKKYSLFSSQGEILKYLEIEGFEEESFNKFVNENQIDLNDTKIGIRIVSPGKIFIENRKVDEDYLERLKEAGQITPLHIEPIIKEIEEIKNKYPDIQIIGVSDSAFHKSIPEYAKIYAIPENLRKKYGIEKQGYHGLSLSSVILNIKKEKGELPEKMIVAHMGGGTSVTALLNGVSIDTSMGWTPLEGVPMAERIGDIDPGALAYLALKENLSGASLEKFISTECGLEAISGIPHGDMKEIIEMSEGSSEASLKARLALEVYIYRVRKYIGAMAAVLGGCDMLVLTGNIAEKSEFMQQQIFKNFEYLASAMIVIPTDEAREIYKVASSF